VFLRKWLRWDPKIPEKERKRTAELLALLVGYGVYRALKEGLIHPTQLWPSSHTWNQIMFASVLILVILGIIALLIFIVRSTHAQ